MRTLGEGSYSVPVTSSTYRELDLLPNVGKVLVPFHDPTLMGRKVRTHKTERGSMEKEADGHRSLVARLS